MRIIRNHGTRTYKIFCELIIWVLYIYIKFFFQVWFQNRRAKFRRNERSILAQRSGLYSREASQQPSGTVTAVEQPLAPRPTAVLPPGKFCHQSKPP